ncbi:uncharacterized protein LOC123523548 [Mercenaria mercenaria]|uniref:uncharacterized protein LOC123523548 n=1 Tax=Mercenaria mercenaria TaxID=6596 RepID=UPI00234FAE14|nr:uncharacterized protein LOC123523548 [Mercenaria mercenaria]
MWSSIVAVSSLGALAAYIIQYRDWIDWNQKFLYRVAPGPCKQVLTDGGSEDVTYIGNGIVIMSSGIGAGEGNGVVKALDLNTSQVVTMKIRGAPDRKDFMTIPHGITTWKDERGNIYVYVLTHPPKEDRIEVFKVKGNNVLKYKRTITDPNFSYMNDLVAVGRDKFYITKFIHYRERPWSILEYMTQNAWAGVMYYDGKKARDVVPTGLLLPNGINISPDGKMVYVAEFGKKILHGYHRSTDNLLTKAWSFDADTLVDNIEVDPDTGDLWIGCHPVAYRILDYMNDFFGLTLPSQVLRFKMEDNMVSAVEEIYADDGTELLGSTAATYVNGKLVIGTVEAQAVVCDVNYLSASTAVLVITAGFTFHYFLLYRDWLHWNQDRVLKVTPGPCQTVKDDGGSEDIVYIGDGIFLMSTGFEFGKLTGDVIGLDINGSPKILTFNKTDVPALEEPILASPHGMTSWTDPNTGKIFLYVLTHPPSVDKIRVFKFLKPSVLKYLKTITDPSFTYMNDLVAVDVDKFYITKYTMYRDTRSIQMEHLSHLRQGKIFYYDGRRAREVSAGYFLPNGINISPDKKMIYMAEWGGQRLYGFKRESTNNLVKVWDMDMGTGVDNIDVDENGDLWIGCHPITWKIADFFNLFGATPPSQVIRVKIRDHTVDDVEEIYRDDGQECSGSTVASYQRKKLVIGTVFQQTVVCDVKYLTN